MLPLTLLLALHAAPADRPLSLEVRPDRLALDGPWDGRQLLVTGRYADGTVRDLTHAAAVTAASPGVVYVRPGAYVEPRGNGATTLRVAAGGRSVDVPVTASHQDRAEPVGFRRQFVAALNVAGCNAGACHGTPSGKNGFRLSLRGFDPAADYLQLTRDALGRRTDRNRADKSLMLQKGEGLVPHEGGARWRPDSVPGRVARAWVSGGTPDDPPGLPALGRVEVLPGPRVLHAPARTQQLAVLAHFADGRVRDVTRLTVFSSSDDAVARVDADGRVEFRRRGEVAVLARYLEELVPVRLTYVEHRPGYRWPDPPESNAVDRHLFDKLKLLGIPPSGLCTDEEFVRRATLDVCGVLPTPDEVRAFLADTRPDKRARLVDALLGRPEYAEFWAQKWADVLNVNRRAIQAKGAFLVQGWLQNHLRADTPFDAVVRELLTAGGSTFLNPPANYFRNDRKVRDTDSLAQNTAQLFLGVRIACAKCHNHPFERWTQDDYYGLAAFFARVQDRPDPLYPRINRFNLGALVIHAAPGGEVIHPRTGKAMPPRFPGGGVPSVGRGGDRRVTLAEWVTSRDNPFFARALANRVWYHLNGKGIVDPVDDFRDSNPAVSDELLDHLARELTDHRYDVKHLIRTITRSRTYQLSAAADEWNRDDDRYFSHAVARLLPAEPLLDALSGATGVPEEFAGMPPGKRAAQLPDGDVYKHPFLLAFGQPARETACECERGASASLGHALALVNGPTVKGKLRAPDNRIGRLLAAWLDDAAVADELYLATLSRHPASGEREAALRYVGKAGADPAARRRAWEDVQWALLGSKEFLFRH